jgi:hypothetical protein
MHRRPVLATFAFLALLPAACSRPPTKSPELLTDAEIAQIEATTTAPPVAPAVKVYIDPATGATREPTAVELAAEAAEQNNTAKMTSEKASAPREIVHPDGTVEVIMDRSNRNPLVGCIPESGKIQTDHECETALKKSSVKDSHQ